MQDIVSWVASNGIELTGALLGLGSIILQIRRKASYWPVVILMVLLYIWVYFDAKFYAYMSFQFYYLAVSIYGWYYWLRHKNTGNSTGGATDIARLNKRSFLILLIITLALFVIFYFVLRWLTDSDIPLGDSFTTAVSCVATWLLAKKYIGNWLFWIVSDVVSTGLYLHKELYPTAILYGSFLVLAVVGYMKWKKEL